MKERDIQTLDDVVEAVKEECGLADELYIPANEIEKCLEVIAETGISSLGQAMSYITDLGLSLQDKKVKGQFTEEELEQIGRWIEATGFLIFLYAGGKDQARRLEEHYFKVFQRKFGE